MKTWIFFAVLLVGILFTLPAAAEEPALFVKLLYANYTQMDHWAKGYDPCHEYCEADFAKLLDAAHRKNMIDYDPICQCKAGGGKYRDVRGCPGRNRRCDYQVTMMKFGDMRHELGAGPQMDQRRLDGSRHYGEAARQTGQRPPEAGRRLNLTAAQSAR